MREQKRRRDRKQTNLLKGLFLKTGGFLKSSAIDLIPCKKPTIPNVYLSFFYINATNTKSVFTTSNFLPACKQVKLCHITYTQRTTAKCQCTTAHNYLQAQAFFNTTNARDKLKQFPLVMANHEY